MSKAKIRRARLSKGGGGSGKNGPRLSPAPARFLFLNNFSLSLLSRSLEQAIGDPDLQIRGEGGGGHSNPEIRGGGAVSKKHFFGPSALILT